MKRTRLNIVLLILFLCTFTVQSVSGTRVRPPVNTAFDGETLYRGLIFRRGPVARRVPELWSLLGLLPLPTSDDSVDALRKGADRRLEVGDVEASEALNKIADAISSGTIPSGSTELTSETTIDATVAATIAAISTMDSTFFARFKDDVQSGDPVKVERAMEGASRITMQVLSSRINSGDQQLDIGVWYYWDIAVAIEVVAVVFITLLAVIPLVHVNNDLVHDEVIRIITERFYVQVATRG